MNTARPWGDSFRIEYFWQETLPEVHNCGIGTLHYDARGQRYAVHNRFANCDRQLGYLLDEARGLAHVFETRDGEFTCHRYRTDRRVRLADQLALGTEEGHGLVPGGDVRFVAYREAGDHDRWLWCVDGRNEPLRFFTWTHHCGIQVVHDLIRLERDVPPDEDAFAVPRECYG